MMEHTYRICLEVLRLRISFLEKHLSEINALLMSDCVDLDIIDYCREISSLQSVDKDIDQYYDDLIRFIDEGIYD